MNNDDITRNININQGDYFEYIENLYLQNLYLQIDTIPRPTGFPQNIPRSSTEKFVGRKQELLLLEEQLQKENQVTIAHLEGMGGIGKTELAIAYSLTNLQCNTYPGSICWLFCRDQDIGLQIVSFARNYLGLTPPEDLELLEQVTWCWQRWQKGNTLIVLDDVTDYEKIETYLPPQSSQFKVLITTRLKLELANPLYLEVLSESESLELLSDLIGSEKVNLELNTAKELCQRLGYLPLALQLVGRYVKKRRISLSEELRRLEEKGLAHPSVQVPEKKTTWVTGIERGVAAAFELSWEDLTESAQELGCLLSLFALAPIPWSLVESAAVEQDPEELEDIRIELEDLHLLQTEDSYQLHQLIQEFFRDKQNGLVNADLQKRNFCSAITLIAEQIPYSLTLDDVKKFTLVIPHVSETASLYINYLNDQDLIKPFVGLGKFYSGQGAYTHAVMWYEQSLLVTKKSLGEENLSVSIILNNLANVYYAQGRYREVEPLYQKAIEISKKNLGGEHPEVVAQLNNLANLYHTQERYKETEHLYQRVIEIDKKNLRESSLSGTKHLNNLANFYHTQGRYKEAEPLYQKAIEIDKKNLGESNRDLAISLNNLALLCSKQGRYKEAESLYQKAIEIGKKTLGEEHPEIATRFSNLANLYYLQGKYKEAKLLYQKAIEIGKKNLGEKHPEIATYLSNLALIYNNQGNYQKAEPLFQEAIDIGRKNFGESHSDVATYLGNLAIIRGQQGRYEEAESLFLQALKIYKQILGNYHPYVANCLNNLASLYWKEGRYKEAKTLFLQALELRTKLLGEEHPDTKNTRENLQNLLEERQTLEVNNSQEAISKKVKDLFEKTQSISGVQNLTDSDIAAEIDLYRADQ